MRRAAVSVPSNIAEGHGRLSDRYLGVFLGHARGSLFELESQTELAVQLGFADSAAGDKLVAQINEVARMLNALVAKVQHDGSTPTLAGLSPTAS